MEDEISFSSCDHSAVPYFSIQQKQKTNMELLDGFLLDISHEEETIIALQSSFCVCKIHVQSNFNGRIPLERGKDVRKRVSSS